MAASNNAQETAESPEPRSAPGAAGSNSSSRRRRGGTESVSARLGISSAAGVEGLLGDAVLLANVRGAGAARSDESRERPDDSVDEARLRRAAFDAMPAAQVILDPDGKLVLVTELGRRLFSLSEADLGSPIEDLKLFSCPVELARHLDELSREGKPIEITRVCWRDGTQERVLDVRIVPLPLRNGLVGASVSYTDVTGICQLECQLADIRRELAHACDQLRSRVEQFEIQLEEQRTMIEQLKITNKQMVSAHEQLEWFHDELQSAQQGLVVLNAELDRRSQERIDRHTLLESIVDARDIDGMPPERGQW